MGKRKNNRIKTQTHTHSYVDINECYLMLLLLFLCMPKRGLAARPNVSIVAFMCTCVHAFIILQKQQQQQPLQFFSVHFSLIQALTHTDIVML